MAAKMHRLHIPGVGEAVVNIPGGVPYEVDTALQFPLGSYMRMGNKGFVYAKAGGTLVPKMGAKNSLAQKVGQVAVAATALIKATTITLTIATGTEITLDELVGGEIVVFVDGVAATNSFTRGITGNNAIATGVGGTLTLTLDSPIPVEVTTDGKAECIASPYSAVTQSSDANLAVVGMPLLPATVGQFLWLQVEGLYWAAPQSLVGVGGNTGIVFRHDGSLEPIINTAGVLSVPDGYSTTQHAGVVVSEASGGTQGAPFILLQIAH